MLWHMAYITNSSEQSTSGSAKCLIDRIDTADSLLEDNDVVYGLFR
jgi:hypothetical protein